MATRIEKSPPAPPAAQETPFAVVLGWLLVVFAMIPLLVGVQSGSLEYLVIGGGFAAAGAVLVAAGRAARRRHRPPRT